MTLFRSSAKRRSRRAWPIHGYVGPNGGGKTAAMVWDTIPSLMRGRHVLSTVRILDFENPRACDDPDCVSENHDVHMAAHPLWIPWEATDERSGWVQLLEVDHCDVLADEMAGVASSRDSASLPSVIQNQLQQLRRRDVIFRWSAPSWARADVIVRETTQAATLCTGFMPTRVEDDEGDRMWAQKRLFRWMTYDAQLLDDFTAAKARGQSNVALKPWCWDWYWGPGSPAFAAYDTYDTVSQVSRVADNGRCLNCDGRRRAEPCNCGYRHSVRGRTSRTEAGGAPAGGTGDGPAVDQGEDVDQDTRKMQGPAMDPTDQLESPEKSEGRTPPKVRPSRHQESISVLGRRNPDDVTVNGSKV